MSYEKDITAAILANTPLVREIGDRFFWDIADGATAPPYIVAQTVSDDGETPHDARRGVSFPTVQFSTWAKTKAEAVRISEILRSEFEGTPIAGESECVLLFANRTSNYDQTTRLFGIVLDFRAPHHLAN
jgi:hypothetical protein